MCKFLTFYIGDEVFSLSLAEVRQVVVISNITEVPNTPSHILGIINLGGEIISVMDIRGYLGLKKREERSSKTLIVLKPPPFTTSIEVTRVGKVLSIDMEPIDGEGNIRGFLNYRGGKIPVVNTRWIREEDILKYGQ